ncbi:MAG: DNA-3-methyladenine glycosylase I [Henriciella sp.]|jgi:3-methyladenine DNA glycosylase Tag|nr:DNA-3-methyladenine glycosylase I [Henriciella sp.]
MRTFDEILDFAAQHHGSRLAVLEAASNGYLKDDLKTVSDSQYLSEMSQAVFSAGFNWTVIRNKWPGFMEAFKGFEPHAVAFFSDEDMDRLLSNTAIVRNGQKIKATIENARFMVGVIKEHGSFGAFLEKWPEDDQAGLLAYLHKNGSRLGGATAQYFLRFAGYDAWITSRDVCAALVREGVLDKPAATSKSAKAKVDQAFTILHEESGQPRSVISRILALSVG